MTEKMTKHSGWKAHRLAQHKEFHTLSFWEKLKRIEEMADFAREVTEERKRKGLPYIDQITGERIPGVAEAQRPYGKKRPNPSNQ